MGVGEEEEEGFISDSSTVTAVPPGVGGAVRSRCSGGLTGDWLMVFLGEIHLIPLELSGEGQRGAATLASERLILISRRVSRGSESLIPTSGHTSGSCVCVAPKPYLGCLQGTALQPGLTFPSYSSGRPAPPYLWSRLATGNRG